MNDKPGQSSIYYNPPQLRAILCDAPEGYHVWGRGTGKSSGLLGWKTKRNLESMPRGVGFLIGETYQQLLSRTMPSLINGLEKLGLVAADTDKPGHFLVGKKPPAKWNWPTPYEPPKSYDHFVSVCNGAGFHLISQDRKGSSNGLNTDWGEGDEAKYLDYEQFQDETLPTMRANRMKFGHLPHHCGLTLTTSMPKAADAKWILKKREEVDQQKLKMVLALVAEILFLQQKIPNASKTSRIKILRAIRKYEAQADALRRFVKDSSGRIIEEGLVDYTEASSFENLAVLGIEYIHRMKRIMPDFIFETEILNKRPDSIEGGFYPDLDLDKHCYKSNYNNSYLESLDYDFTKTVKVNSRMDADCISTLPLKLAIDWGAKINCMSIRQDHQNTLWFINEMFVKHPLFLDHLAQNFIEYYEYHQCKEVFITPDHTGHTRQANSDLTYAQQFTKLLTAAGWLVHMDDRRKAPSHQQKYLLNHKILSEEDATLPKVRINRQKCACLLNSMLQAPVIQDKDRGIMKDKRSERNDNIPAEDATHFSDTFDIHIEDRCRQYLEQEETFIDILLS